MKKKLLFVSSLSLSLMLFFSSCLFEDEHKKKVTDAIQSAVDSHFNAASVRSGISVALYNDGYTWTYSTGSAANGVHMTDTTPGYAYSITKTIISALVLTQIENGLYSLDDTVDGLLAGNPDYDSLSSGQKALLNTGATVAQLLTHTSGMPDYASNIDPLVELCNPANSWKPVDILEKIVNKPVANIGQFQYSNTNYILLGMIAEHKGGAALNVLLSTAFFTPLALDIKLGPQDAIPSDISYPYDDAAIFGLPADSFTYLTDTLNIFYPTYNFFTGVGRATWAAGGIISNAEDLAIWGYELYDDSGYAVSQSVRNTLKNSASSGGSYGYGVTYSSFTYKDGTTGGKFGHAGSAPGYKTLLRYETSRRIAVVIMTNANNIPDYVTTEKDSELGLVDREALADALLNAYNDSH